MVFSVTLYNERGEHSNTDALSLTHFYHSWFTFLLHLHPLPFFVGHRTITRLLHCSKPDLLYIIIIIPRERSFLEWFDDERIIIIHGSFLEVRLPFFLSHWKKETLSRSLSFHHIITKETAACCTPATLFSSRASLATFEGIEEESAVAGAAREAYTLASELSRSNERARIMQLVSVSWCQPTPTLDKPYQPLHDDDVLAAEKRSA